VLSKKAVTAKAYLFFNLSRNDLSAVTAFLLSTADLTNDSRLAERGELFRLLLLELQTDRQIDRHDS